MLKANQIYLTKGSTLLLENLSLYCPAGRITLLLGKSGSGKTSLLRCMAGLEKEYRGELLYEEECLRTLAPRERCQRVGFLPQSFPLFPHMNATLNCAKALRLLFGASKKEATDRAAELLAKLGMAEMGDRFPHQLSGGQQQRVALARALMLNPGCLMLDEPTSALDPENSRLLAQLLLELAGEGRGIVIATQDMAFAAQLLDRAYLLEEGKLVEAYDSETGPLPEESRIQRFLV